MRLRLLVACTLLALAAPAAAQEPAAAESADARETVAFARRLGDAFATVAERVSPSVVSLRVEVPADRRCRRMGRGFPGFGPRRGGPGVLRGGGSGVIVRADGHILTNRHVVARARRITVHLRDGRRLPAEVVGLDPATDLAVVRVQAEDLPVARFASRDGIRVGEWAIAIGSPYGLDYTVTAGVVSAVGRGVGVNEIEDYVQTDASINPGNSGGPLVNLGGEVIGINTMIVGRGTGIGFAVVSDLAQQVAEQLIDGGEVRRAWIGVSFQPLTPDVARQVGAPPGTRGALVSDVMEGGPAAEAGLRPGDVIVAVNGRRLREGNDLLRQVVRVRPGAELRLLALREGRRRRFRIRAGERPDRQAVRSGTGENTMARVGPHGLALEPVSPALARRRGLEAAEGAHVVAVRPGSLAARAGLMQGDVIVEADRRPVEGPEQVRAALEDGEALLRVRRGRGALFVAIRAAGDEAG